MAVAEKVGRESNPYAAGGALASLSLPGAPTAQLAPVALTSSAQGAANQQLSSGVDANGQPLGQAQAASLRDLNKEASMAKSMGGAPKNAQETAQMIKATYSPDVIAKDPELSAMVKAGQVNQVNTGVAGSSPVFQGGASVNPALLKQMGYTDAQIANIVAQTNSAGQTANTAQDKLNSLSTPTNMNIRVLENALNAKNNVTNQALGESDLFKQAGLGTSLSVGNLMNSLGQRGQEMQSKYDSFKTTVSDAAAPQLQYYQQALDGYKSTMDQYKYQQDRLDQINQKASDYETQLDLMNRKAKIDQEAFDHQQKIESKKFQFVPATDNQDAGFFDPNTGKFQPLTVGGDSYNSSGAKSSAYLGDGVQGNNAALTYSNAVPHGSANVAVTQSNPSLIDIYKNGFKKAAGPNGLGGQCAYEAEQWVNLDGKPWAVGNSIQQKAASLAKFAKQGLAFYKGQGTPEVGNAVISNDDPQYGHVWVINAITDDGKLVASEFNRAGSRVYSNNRIVDPNDKSILGFLKTEPKSAYQVKAEGTAAGNIKKAVDGVKQIAQGKVQGGLLDLASAALMVGKDALVDQGKKNQQSAAVADAKAKVDAGIKAGLLDQNGTPFSPERAGVRSGTWTDTMLNQTYADLKTKVKKGIEPQAALDAFQQDFAVGKEKQQQIVNQQKLQDKYSTPMNENQTKSIGFAVSAKQAEGFMPKNGNDKSLAGLNDWFNRSAKEDDVVSDKVNEIRDPIARQIVQSEMQWVANVLRGESGASIAASEYKSAGLTYFPRPGDDQATLDRKKAAREQKVQNLLIGGGPQGANYWQNLGYDLPPAVAKQFGMEANQKDSLGLFGGEADHLGLGIS